MADKTRLHIL